MRAAASLAVAFSHFGFEAVAHGGDPRGWIAAALRAFPFDAGVDVFFVISGFVIVHASASLFAAPGGWAKFLRRRLRRIVPLYWLATSAFLAVLWLGRARIHGDIGGWRFILASYCFVPWPRPDGVMQPALGLGWTLNYELFFYACFTPFLVLRRMPAVAALLALFASLAAFGAWHGFGNLQLTYWANPLILEFCAGMLIAQAFGAGLRLPLAACAALALVAAVLMHLCAHGAPAWRPLLYGGPASLLVLAAAAAPSPRRDAATRWLLRLGAASYALYLVHPFLMRGLEPVLRRAPGEAAGMLYLTIGILLAQLCALGLHTHVEKPLDNRLGGLKS